MRKFMFLLVMCFVMITGTNSFSEQQDAEEMAMASLYNHDFFNQGSAFGPAFDDYFTNTSWWVTKTKRGHYLIGAIAGGTEKNQYGVLENVVKYGSCELPGIAFHFLMNEEMTKVKFVDFVLYLPGFQELDLDWSVSAKDTYDCGWVPDTLIEELIDNIYF